MNKNELIRELQKTRGGTLSDSKAFLETFMSIVTKELESDHEVCLQGFGTLRAWHQAGRAARNPRTGTPVMLAPRVSVKFRPGKFLLDTLNEK